MQDQEIQVSLAPLKRVGAITLILSILLILGIILQHNLSFQKNAQTIIPAGNTYLGPPKTETPKPITPAPTEVIQKTPTQAVQNTTLSQNTQGKIEVEKNAVWKTVRGRIYPYTFQAPEALTLTTFPKDPYDIYAISYMSQPPDQNVLIGVDDLSRQATLKQYITLSKRSYVENWWKQFGGLKGVASIKEFTNKHGLKGYRAKYLNSNNQSPNEDVFFEVSDTKYVIHLASGILASSVFDQIIDSVSWGKK